MNACRFARYGLGAALFLLAFSSGRTFAQEVAKLPAGLAEVVRLVTSGVENDVILSYIQH